MTEVLFPSLLTGGTLNTICIVIILHTLSVRLQCSNVGKSGRLEKLEIQDNPFEQKWYESRKEGCLCSEQREKEVQGREFSITHCGGVGGTGRRHFLSLTDP